MRCATAFVGFALVGLLAACGEHNGDESPETETICQKINPCENGGMCASVPDGSFTCTCVDNWSGDRCDQGQCEKLQPCENGGTCANSPTGEAQCTCDGDWTGSTCETEIDASAPCDSDPCGSHGRCEEEQDGSFTCSCADNWSGARCDQGQCEELQPCQHGGTCANAPDGSFTCTCVDNWSGDRCDQGQCEELQPCQNGGTCANAPDGSFMCSCVLEWRGDVCELSECDIKPDFCQGHGICESYTGTGEAMCLCHSPWNGPNCTDCGTRCSSREDYYRERFLYCMETMSLDQPYCLDWAGCDGELYIDSNYGTLVFPLDPLCPQP